MRGRWFAQRKPYNAEATLACEWLDARSSARERPIMFDLNAALQAGNPQECTLDAVVTDEPREYYGNRTHAEHEDFHVVCQGKRLEVVQNLNCSPNIPVRPGDGVTLHGELVPHGSHGPLMHWTHHDPSGRHEDGYVIDAGRRYE